MLRRAAQAGGVVAAVSTAAAAVYSYRDPQIAWDDVVARAREAYPLDDASRSSSPRLSSPTAAASGGDGGPSSSSKSSKPITSTSTSSPVAAQLAPLEQVTPGASRAAHNAHVLHAEIVVLGAGIAGAATAYHLGKLLRANSANAAVGTPTDAQEAGQRCPVVLLDRGFVGAEASGLSAGTIHCGGTGLFADVQRGTSKIIRELEQEGFDCAYVQSGALTLATTKEEADFLKEEVRQAGTDAGMLYLDGYDKVVAVEPALAGGRACGAILTPESGYVDPTMCTHAFADAASANKVEVMIHEGAEVVSISRAKEKTAEDAGGQDPAGYELETKNGLTLRCRKLVLCPGAWSGKVGHLLGISIPVGPVKGQIWVTEDTPSTFLQHVIFVAESKLAFLHEFRHNGPRGDLPKYTTHDKDRKQFIRHAYGRRLHDGRVIFGGDRIPCRDPDNPAEIYAIEEETVRKNRAHVYEFCPELEQYGLQGVWSGPMPFSQDGLPFVGDLAACGLPDVWILTGLGPHGIMDGPMLSKILASAMFPSRPGALHRDLVEDALRAFKPDREGGITRMHVDQAPPAST